MGLKAFRDCLQERRVMLADGAMGTMLIQEGLSPGACPESVNIASPDAVAAINRRYLEAGAQILETCTFGANPLKLGRHNLAERTEEINRAAAAITRSVAGKQAYVAACIGPSGRVMKPYGDTDAAAVRAGFDRQVKALADAGVDVFWIETMTDLREAVIAVETVKKNAAAIPVIAAMTFVKTPRGYFTIMGNSVEQAVRGLAASGADAVGSNCGNGFENMIEICRAMAELTPLAVAVRPNAGMPVLVDNRAVYPETPEFFAAGVGRLVAAGALIVGGCCGTTPEHIRQMAKAMPA